ncbi:16015ef1-ec6d-4698-895f-96bd1c7aed6d [Sclerotinia trifoliorum]|uniref:16015ef1-ec6d-4698-895f-96bd1c7aed6d n=1 Tax=Sclerotinia trifoliorum TaxID=28548 RepID=A0A8H2W3L2_9HELO|nr:16015ef1-ec6d-4698-895f-96bd1c7aed6d [Sclerotinia trifoliorum]
MSSCDLYNDFVVVSFSENIRAESMVKIIVGDERKIWWLNEDLLCAHSIVFKRAFQGKFLEFKEKVIVLEEESPKPFHHLVGRVSVLQHHKSHDDLIYSCLRLEEWAALVKLSQMSMMDYLMQAAIDRYNKCKTPHDWPEDIMPCTDVEEVKYICDHISTSTLRLGIVHGLAATFLKRKMHEDMFELWYLSMSCYPDLIHDVLYEVKMRLEEPKASSIKEDFVNLERTEAYDSPFLVE